MWLAEKLIPRSYHQLRNATTTIRAEDGTLLASFAAGSIGLEQDITVRADRTLNATTADFAQFFVGSTAATGAFNTSSTIAATGLISANGGLAVAGTTTSDSVELTTELQSPIVPAHGRLPYVNTGSVYMGGALVADSGLVTTSS